MSTAGTITVSLAAEIAQFTSAMDKAANVAEQRMRQIDKSLGVVKTALVTLGAGAAAGLTLDKLKDKIVGVIEAASRMEEIATKTGATVEALSGLASIARLSGTDADALGLGLQKLAKSMVDAENGGTKTSAAFKAIGVSVEDLKGKSPDQVFQLIAQKMANFKDGTEKVVIAQLLLGKAGANLLPVLKDLAQIGDYQVKLTKEQAEQARQLTVDWQRLQLSSEGLWKTLALAMVPTMDDFVKQLISFQKESGGVKKGIDDLAKDHTIRDWAQNGAIAVSYLVEALQGVGKMALAVGGSFKSVWADVQFAGKYATPIVGPALLAKDVVTGEFTKRLDERNKVAADANERYKDLINYNGTALSDGLKKRFRTSNIASDFGISYGEQESENRRHGLGVEKTINTAGLGNANKGPKDDPAAAVMNGIIKQQEQAVAFQRKATAEADAMLQESYAQQYMTASQFYDGKKALIEDELQHELASYDKEMSAAQAYIDQADTEQKKQQGRNQLSLATAKYIDAVTEAESKKAKVTMEANKPLREFELTTREVVYQYGLQNTATQFQIDMMGRNTLEVQKLTAARQIDLAVQQRIHELDLKGIKGPERDRLVAEEQAKADAQKAIVIAQITSAYDLQRDSIFGAHEALRKYVEDSTNGAAQMENVVGGAFKGMEDALVNFVKTGKLNFSSLVDSIIADIARMVIQQQVTGPLAGMLMGWLGRGVGSNPEGYGGTFNNPSAFVGGARASGGPVQAGMAYLVGEKGPEIFTSPASGNIIPNDQIGGGGGGPTIIINNTIGDVASKSDVVAGMQTVRAQIGQSLQRSKQYAGAMAS